MNTLLAVATGGGIAAVAAILGVIVTNWQAARRDRTRYEHEDRTLDARHEHERRMAHETRRQQRMERVYDEVAQLTGAVGLWAEFTRRLMTSAGDPQPELPTVIEQARVGALLKIHGSSKVQDRYKEWRAVVVELIHADADLRSAEHTEERGRESGIDSAAIWKSIINDIKPRESKLRDALSAAIAEEYDRL